MEWQEVSKYLFGALISISLWLIKDIFKQLKELKQWDLENKDKIRDNFFAIDVTKEQVKQNTLILEKHEERLDSHDKKIQELVIINNNIDCPKHPKVTP